MDRALKCRALFMFSYKLFFFRNSRIRIERTEFERTESLRIKSAQSGQRVQNECTCSIYRSSASVSSMIATRTFPIRRNRIFQ